MRYVRVRDASDAKRAAQRNIACLLARACFSERQRRVLCVHELSPRPTRAARASQHASARAGVLALRQVASEHDDMQQMQGCDLL